MNADDVPARSAYVELPRPAMTGGASLRSALAQRRSTREFSAKALPLPVLSDLLWCAQGVNRPDTGGRTAPSARNWREIEVHVITAEGAFVYEPGPHRLKRLAYGDLRAHAGQQPFVAQAPVNLAYVADLSRIDAASPVERRFYTAADAAFIAQNVYLFCAAEGLATVVRGLVDRRRLARVLGLGPSQRVILAQTVGYPAGAG